VAIAVSSPVKVSCSLTNWTRTPLAVSWRTVAQVVEVAGEAVHGVHEDGVAVADEAEHRLELGAVQVFSGGAVGERLVELNAVELADGVLVQGADPEVADALSADEPPTSATPRPACAGLDCDAILGP
jgi:hypothetical protein